MVARIREVLEPFFVGPGGRRMTQDEISRQREIASALMQRGNPAFHNAGWLGAIGRGLEGAYSGWSDRQASQAEQTNAAENQDALSRVLEAFGGGTSGGILGGSPATSTSMATAPAPDYASARVAQAHGDSGGSFLPQSFLGALDRTEGAGNYDTLFGHAQRSGPFAGTSVSQMPIRDVLAFASPSGAYGQYVKGQVGRVATPMGRHQIVGTTLRNAVGELGIDPSTPFNAQTQDQIAAHLAKRRIAGASTMDGKIAGLRSEWEGFRSVPRADMEQIVRDLESMPANAVAANEAMASGDLSSGMTPDALQQWAAQNYAPEQAAGVTVAETPEEILAAEAAMSASPGTQPRLPQAAPPLPEPTMVQDMPVADIARALTGATVNPDLPMAGSTSGFAPAGTQAPNVSLPQESAFSLPNPQQQQAAAQQAGGFSPELIQLLSSPYTDSNTRQIAMSLLGQQMQQADPYRQAQLEKLRLETEALRNPEQKPIEVGGVLLDRNTMQPIFDSRDRTPSNVREYEYYANAETAAGRQPMPFGDWDQSRRRSGATNISVGGDGAPGLGKLSADYGYVMDPETRQPVIDTITGLPQAAPIPGSPAAQSIEDAERQREAARTNAANYARTVTQDIGIADDYLGQIEGMAAEDGVIGANLRNTRAGIAGTPENNMKSFVDSALSNVTLDTMNRMRESSPAGATGFGNMSERQMEVIRGVLGNWKPSLPVEDQRMILHRLGNFYLDVQFGSEQERQEAVRDGRMSPVENDAIQELYYPETRDIRGRRINEGGNRTSSGVQWSIE